MHVATPIRQEGPHVAAGLARRGRGRPRGARTEFKSVVPLIAFTGVAAWVAPLLPQWAAMWTLAFAVFFGCKALTWLEGERTDGPRRRRPSGRGTARTLAYLVAWPGMDYAAFVRRGDPRATEPRRVAGALTRIGIGAALVWGIAPFVLPTHPLLAGWVGMTGLILMLHFGALDLIGLFWRARGVEAKPLMNAPTRATSLADFWGNRWNTAFHDLARRCVFMPLRRPLGAAGATLATFLASGLVHDLVISAPAGAGYGLPTLYFVIQGLGVLAERTRPGRRAGLGRGLPGRLFAAAVVLAPLPWLFHEPFVTRVILPFLEAIR